MIPPAFAIMTRQVLSSGSRLRFFIIGGLLANPVLPAAPSPGRDRTLCVAQFGVQDDRFVARLEITREGAYGAEAAKNPELVASFNALLTFRLPLSVWSKSDADIRTYVRIGPHAPQPELAGTQDWENARDNLRRVPGNQRLLVELLTQIVRSDFFTRALESHTPFRVIDDGDPNLAEDLLQHGRVELRLLDPVAAIDVAPDAILFAELGRKLPREAARESRAGVDRAALSAALQPLVGRPWVRRDIQVRIADWYQSRGAAALEPVHLAQKIAAVDSAIFDPANTESTGNLLQGLWEKSLLSSEYGLAQTHLYDRADRAANRRILVTEPRHVSRIVFVAPKGTPSTSLHKPLYALLDDTDWREARRIGLVQLVGSPVTITPTHDAYRIAVDRVRHSRPTWPLFSNELRWRSGPLLPLGYSVAAAPGDGRRSILKVVAVERDQAERAAVEPDDSAGTSEPSADKEELTDDEAAKPPVNPRQELEKRRTEPRLAEKEHRHFVQFSAGYKAGQGTELRGGYRQVLLADRSAAAEVTLGVMKQPLGDFGLKKDFVFFEQLGRRLAIDLKGYSNFTPDAPAGNQTPDERRNGARLGAGLELWRARAGNWLGGRMDLHREQVKSKPDAGGFAAVQNDSSVQLSATWFHRKPGRLGAPELTVDAAVRYARQDAGDYSTWSLIAREHLFVGGFMQAELTARVAGATNDTPLLERPRLGGAESVRGYREDAVAGTEVVAARAELWFSLRGLESRWPNFGPTLRRQFVAAFVDSGWYRADRVGRAMAGAGLGLRVALQPGQVIKLDVARGLRNSGSARAGTRLHLDMSADFPF